MTDRALGNRIWTPPLLLTAAGGVALVTIDHATGAYFSAHPVDGVLQEFFDAAEQFGTPFGQLLLLLVLGCLGHRTGITMQWSWDVRMLRVFATAVIAGLSANVIKLLFARIRPRGFDFALSLTAGLGPLFPFGTGGSNHQSFPSGHSASAFGFAVALSWAWPRQRPLFFFLAALVGLQRILTGAHFPSDVFAGAALGYLVATLYIHNAWVTRCWDALEQRLFGRHAIHVDVDEG